MNHCLAEQNKNLPTTNSSPVNGDLPLKELMFILWSGKVAIIVITAFAAALTLLIAISLPDIYKSEALLAPVTNDNKGVSNLKNNFGSLANLAGVSLGGRSLDKTTMGMEVLKSRQFFKDFLAKHDVIVPLMAATGWNPAENTLQIDRKLYDTTTKTWIHEGISARKSKPSVQNAHRKFLKLFSVSQDKKSGFVKISIEHYSPYIAQQWVYWLIADINETIRKQDVLQAEKSVAYLKEQINETSLKELQAGFFELIQSQIETIMLARANPEYLFKTIDPAVVPEFKAKPNRSHIVVIGTLLGGVLGVLLVLLWGIGKRVIVN